MYSMIRLRVAKKAWVAAAVHLVQSMEVECTLQVDRRIVLNDLRFFNFKRPRQVTVVVVQSFGISIPALRLQRQQYFHSTSFDT
jgi:hypothetical protein